MSSLLKRHRLRGKAAALESPLSADWQRRPDEGIHEYIQRIAPDYMVISRIEHQMLMLQGDPPTLNTDGLSVTEYARRRLTSVNFQASDLRIDMESTPVRPRSPLRTEPRDGLILNGPHAGQYVPEPYSTLYNMPLREIRDTLSPLSANLQQYIDTVRTTTPRYCRQRALREGGYNWVYVLEGTPGHEFFRLAEEAGYDDIHF